MSLIRLPDGWMRFGSGRKWRCAAPAYLCEVDSAGNAPDYLNLSSTLAKVRRVKAVYAGRLSLGPLDEFGAGLDIIVANSFTESFGTVPSPLSASELRGVYERAIGTEPCVKLDEVIRHISMRARYLERREPRYADPISTPGQVSVGAHHALISTALRLNGYGRNTPIEQKTAETIDLVCRMPAESLYAAGLAIQYFNESRSGHFNQPPLLAAAYNADSARPDPSNPWNLKQYGAHVDRWVTYYNTSRRA
ncbi:MAG: hypothetical protein HY894_05850 [Deltaproteobacteria bacterium]|nr:hypothetical protein [Deltaproteobacteria bacterium]